VNKKIKKCKKSIDTPSPWGHNARDMKNGTHNTNHTKGAGMKKLEQNAYREFIATITDIAKDDCGTYFDDLIGTEAKVCQNIANDFPAFCGIFTLDAQVEAQVGHLKAQAKEKDLIHKHEIAALEDRIADLEKNDVRTLVARKAELLRKLDAVEGIKAELDGIQNALEG